MSDEALTRKFLRTAEGVLCDDVARRITELVWELDRVKDAGQPVRLSAPS
jgi:hypothetical protein